MLSSGSFEVKPRTILSLVGTGTELKGIRAGEDAKPLDIILVLLREFQNTDIGIDRRDTAAAQVCPRHQEIPLDFQGAPSAQENASQSAHNRSCAWRSFPA